MICHMSCSALIAQELYYFPQETFGQEDWVARGEGGAKGSLSTLAGWDEAYKLADKMGWNFGNADKKALKVDLL